MNKLVLPIALVILIFIVFVGGVAIGEARSVAQWAPVRAKLELSYLKALSKTPEGQNQPIFDTHQRELDVQLIAHLDVQKYRWIHDALDYLFANPVAEIRNQWMKEAALYRKNNPYTISSYSAETRKQVDAAITKILAPSTARPGN